MNEFGWHVLSLALGLAVVIEGLALVATLKHLGAILVRMGPDTYGDVEEGPAIGTRVDPRLELFEKLPGIVLFVSPTCSLCKPIVGRLPLVRREFPHIPILAAVIGDEGAPKEQYMKRLDGMARADLDGLYQEWKVPGTPFAAGVGSDGTIVARGVINSVGQMEALISGTPKVPVGLIAA